MASSSKTLSPVIEPQKNGKRAPPCILVIFGATGDLTARKLMPALYNLEREGLLPANFACVGAARREKTDEQFRAEMKEAVAQFSRSKPLDEAVWKRFAARLYYHITAFSNDPEYETLGKRLNELDTQLGTQGNRVFYLSTQPSFFPLITEKLHQHKLVYPFTAEETPFSRIIIEKPFGRDLNSAIELQQHILKFFDERQIYRIDHYLGKETVQNLLVFRFANPIFEAVWNNVYVDNVQITVGEEIGVGTRGRFWEEAGLLRDIMQNHMMQLLSLVAMEPPTNLRASAIQNEKVKVLEAIRPVDLAQIDQYVVRGQYAKGTIEGKEAIGYRQEGNVDPNSSIETFMAMKLYIDNWRWANVPFYLRGGKRLPKRSTEILITFKPVPSAIFGITALKQTPNVLAIRIQPNEGISVKINCKVPGLAQPTVQPVKMDFRYDAYFGMSPPDAYERLICDCMLGDRTLFARGDEVLASWRIFTPILEHWTKERPKDFPNYACGTWGPQAAEALLAHDGREWHTL